MRSNHALHSVMAAVVGMAGRVGATDARARTMIAGFALIAGAAASGRRALGGSTPPGFVGAIAVVAGGALRTVAGAMNRVLALVAGTAVAARG